MRSSRLALAAPAAALMIAALAGCGGGQQGQAPVQEGPHINASLELADCSDWNRSGVEDRLGTLRQLKAFAGGPIVGVNGGAPAGRGAVLDDKKAYELLTNYCKADLARGFKLYKIYDRAAAFAGKPAQ